MTRVPLVIPSSSRASGNDNQVARLERWRDFLLAKIDAEERPRTLPTWLRTVVLALIPALGMLLFAGILSAQVAITSVVWMFVISGLLMFVLSREVQLFGIRFLVGDVVASIFQGMSGPPVGLIGTPDLREQLAQCEAELSKLRERRP
jgi:hypothetical protein